MEFRNAIIDSSAFQEATGWRPKFDFESGIEASYNSVSTTTTL
jgi:nucleoside-diphosphate-sugar epimerase